MRAPRIISFLFLLLIVVACRAIDPSLELDDGAVVECEACQVVDPISPSVGNSDENSFLPAVGGEAEAFLSPLPVPGSSESPLSIPTDSSPVTSPLSTPQQIDESELGRDQTRVFDLVVLHLNDTWGYYDPCG